MDGDDEGDQHTDDYWLNCDDVRQNKKDEEEVINEVITIQLSVKVILKVEKRDIKTTYTSFLLIEKLVTKNFVVDLMLTEEENDVECDKI